MIEVSRVAGKLIESGVFKAKTEGFENLKHIKSLR